MGTCFSIFSCFIHILLVFSSFSPFKRYNCSIIHYFCWLKSKERLPYRYFFVILYVLFCSLYGLCCVCLFSMSYLFPWVIFFWFQLGSWFPWLLFKYNVNKNLWIKCYTTWISFCFAFYASIVIFFLQCNTCFRYHT